MSEFACVLSAALGFIAGIAAAVVAEEWCAEIKEDDTDAD